MIDERMRSGTKAATTITSGKNETNAFPASATLRSTNSISSMRSHTRQRSSRSNRVRSAAMRWRISVMPVRLVIFVSSFDPAMAAEPAGHLGPFHSNPRPSWTRTQHPFRVSAGKGRHTYLSEHGGADPMVRFRARAGHGHRDHPDGWCVRGDLFEQRDWHHENSPPSSRSKSRGPSWPASGPHRGHRRVRWHLRLRPAYRDIEEPPSSGVSRLTTSPSTSGCCAYARRGVHAFNAARRYS